MEHVLNELSNNYYNDEGQLQASDDRFDDLQKDWQIKNGCELPIGCEPKVGKVKLPKHMPSMSKLLNKSAFDRWKSKFNAPYMISSKMDGVSILISEHKAYTRGDGTYGQDVTWMKNLLGIPSTPANVLVRGELILPNDSWNMLKEHDSKFKGQLAFTSGRVNAKTPIPELDTLLKYYAFEYVIDGRNSLPLSEQYNRLSDLGYNVVKHARIEGSQELQYEYLQSLLCRFRDVDNNLVLDGIIIAQDKEHEVKEYGNVDWAFAYKDCQVAITIVTSIDWSGPSAYGVYTPVLEIEPVELDKTYTYVTAHNAKYLITNRCGIGSIITLGVKTVPRINDVIECSDDIPCPDNVKWEGVNIVTTLGRDTLMLPIMVRFFEELDIKMLRETTVKKLFNMGYNTVESILGLNEDQMVALIGANGKIAHNSMISKWNSASEAVLMSSSSLFRGMGVKTLCKLTEYGTPEELMIRGIEDICIEDIGESRKMTLLDNIDDYLVWKDKLISVRNREYYEETTKSDVDLTPVVMTGKPSVKGVIYTKEQFARKANVIESNMSKAKYLLTNDTESDSNKTRNARKRKIMIITYDEFMDNFKPVSAYRTYED